MTRDHTTTANLSRHKQAPTVLGPWKVNHRVSSIQGRPIEPQSLTTQSPVSTVLYMGTAVTNKRRVTHGWRALRRYESFLFCLYNGIPI
ncbi:hypothetical protein E2C01_037992 [Portunus trituberculatus]|uniref:Uncharacterized protein n=1 Tax=Portunus trituberculatus TaxID=210409 RepID=A0A5B7FGE9_PORTR|nr:hypothetical protein [Portunus trituberculatus]